MSAFRRAPHIPGTNYFISTEIDGGETRLWNRSWSYSATSICPDGMTVDASRDGKLVAIGTLRGEVILWDAANQKERSRWKAADGSITCVRFSPDASILAVANGPTWLGEGLSFSLCKGPVITLFNMASCEKMQTTDVIYGHAVSIEFDSGGKRVFYATSRHDLGCWSVHDRNDLWKRDRIGDGKSVLTLEASFLSLSPDNKNLLWGDEVYDASNKKLRRRIKVDGVGDCNIGHFLDDDTVLLGSRGGEICLVKWRSNRGWIKPASRNGDSIIALDVSREDGEAITGTRGAIGGFDAMSSGVRIKDPYIRLWALPKWR